MTVKQQDRDLEKLRPDVRAAWVDLEARCRGAGIDLLLTEGYRSDDRQDWLFAAGRTRPGKIVTNARAGESDHNARDDEDKPASLAFDVCFIATRTSSGAAATVTWSGPWRVVGRIATDLCGLRWGGDWRKKDRPHFYAEA